MMCQLYNIFPRILQYLPGSHQTLFRNWRKLQLFVSDIVNNHRRDWDPDEPRDFIDAFLTEMTKVGRCLLCCFLIAEAAAVQWFSVDSTPCFPELIGLAWHRCVLSQYYMTLVYLLARKALRGSNENSILTLRDTDPFCYASFLHLQCQDCSIYFSLITAAIFIFRLFDSEL